jgi:hypothetical protein
MLNKKSIIALVGIGIVAVWSTEASAGSTCVPKTIGGTSYTVCMSKAIYPTNSTAILTVNNLVCTLQQRRHLRMALHVGYRYVKTKGECSVRYTSGKNTVR